MEEKRTKVGEERKVREGGRRMVRGCAALVAAMCGTAWTYLHLNHPGLLLVILQILQPVGVAVWQEVRGRAIGMVGMGTRRWSRTDLQVRLVHIAGHQGQQVCA